MEIRAKQGRDKKMSYYNELVTIEQSAEIFNNFSSRVYGNLSDIYRSIDLDQAEIEFEDRQIKSAFDYANGCFRWGYDLIIPATKSVCNSVASELSVNIEPELINRNRFRDGIKEIRREHIEEMSVILDRNCYDHSAGVSEDSTKLIDKCVSIEEEYIKGEVDLYQIKELKDRVEVWGENVMRSLFSFCSITKTLVDVMSQKYSWDLPMFFRDYTFLWEEKVGFPLPDEDLFEEKNLI